jgi:hypothetical protein
MVISKTNPDLFWPEETMICKKITPTHVVKQSSVKEMFRYDKHENSCLKCVHLHHKNHMVKTCKLFGFRVSKSKSCDKFRNA